MTEHSLIVEELDRKIEAIERQRAQYRLELFKIDENIVSFLINFEKIGKDVGVRPDFWSDKLVTLLPCVAGILEHLSAEEAHDFDRVKRALFGHFAALSPVDSESREYKYSTEARS